MRRARFTRQLILLSSFLVGCTSASGAELKVLFLGDNGHHRPKNRFDQLQPVLAKQQIELSYTDKMADLNADNLSNYHALLVYANIDRIEAEPEKAILNYVAGGGGFVPIHCATFCFRNSDAIVDLMGAQFQRHGVGTFRTEIVLKDHPIMQGFGGFESWDETYVHHLHNEKNRTVLSYRVDGDHHEPWTWVRTHGKGRVFYTAWGHDHRTWGNPGFQNLIERGIRWAAGTVVSTHDYWNDQRFPVPKLTPKRKDVEPFRFTDVGAKIPNYPAGERWGTQEAPMNKMQLPLPPEESIKHFVTPEGFRLELFASEPQLGGKPIAMAWDERGRLWVAETYDYPNELQPAGKGRDRIRICEDTDGDWKADKFTVFADKLSIPLSITFYRGSVIVQDGTQTLVLTDTDGDDIADERSVLFSGWNQRDTHGGVSNFQYGLDNWIWAMQGYNTSQPKNDRIDGSVRFAAGFFRFRPDGSDIEFIRSTNNNTWGLGISEEGIIFGSTANRNPSVYMPIPNRYYEQVQGWATSLVLGTIADTHLFQPITKNVRQVDQHGGYTAGAGHALYTARTYPQEYWNRVAFVNGPTGHLVGAFILNRNGSDFRSTSPFNLVASDDEWSAPIMTEIGPDGNAWILDWYNYIVQHNPTPRGFKTGRGNAYETDLRDKKHGRIYRLVFNDAPPAKPQSLKNASPEKLVETLKSDNMLWRKHAQRLLVERGKQDVFPLLGQLVQDRTTDAIGLNTAAIHALWTIHGLKGFDCQRKEINELACEALHHPSAGVRRNAIQVLPVSSKSVSELLNADLLADPDPQVRLAATLALADLPSTDDAGKALADFASLPGNLTDRWLSDATIAAAAKNSGPFLVAIANRDAVPRQLMDKITIVAAHHGRQGTIESIPALVEQLTTASPDVASTIIRGIASGWPADQKPALTAATEKSLEQLLDRLDAGGRGQLLKLAAIWGSERLTKFTQQIINDLLVELDSNKSEKERTNAARRLIEFQTASDSAVQEILKRITPQTAPSLATSLIDVLRISEAPQLGEVLIQNLPSVTPAVRKQAILVLLSRRNATSALLNAIDSGKVQLAELTLDQQQGLARHPDRELRRLAERLLKRGGALPNADRLKVLKEWFEVAEAKGDAVSGKAIYKKTCAKCHRHGGEGENVGPDLTGMAIQPKDELLIHILDPNRSVEGNFRVYNVVTADGRVFNGMLASESKTAIELFDAEGKKTSILRSDVESFVGSQKSLMPDGFEKQIKKQEMTDLLEFLTKRGTFSAVEFQDVATAASDYGLFNPGEGVFTLDEGTDKTVQGVPFKLIKPNGNERKNVVLLHGPLGSVCKEMPKKVEFAVGKPIRSLHLLSGVSGWGFPYSRQKTISMIVRVHYQNGATEDHELLNAEHFADYIRRSDVPKSEFAFAIGSHQMRYLAVHVGKSDPVAKVEFVKGPDQTAPVVMAATIEE